MRSKDTDLNELQVIFDKTPALPFVKEERKE